MIYFHSFLFSLLLLDEYQFDFDDSTDTNDDDDDGDVKEKCQEEENETQTRSNVRNDLDMYKEFVKELFEYTVRWASQPILDRS